MNSAAAKLLGWTEEELRGKSMHDVDPFPACRRLAASRGRIAQLLQVRPGAEPSGWSTRRFTAQGRDDLSRSPTPRRRCCSGTSSSTASWSSSATPPRSSARRERDQRELDTLAWVGRVSRRHSTRTGSSSTRSRSFRSPAGKPSEELLLRMIGPNGEVDPARELPAGRREVRADRRDRPVGDRRGGSSGRPAAGASRRTSRPSRSANLDLLAADRTRAARYRCRSRERGLRDHRDRTDGRRRGRRGLRSRA